MGFAQSTIATTFRLPHPKSATLSFQQHNERNSPKPEEYVQAKQTHTYNEGDI